MAELGFYLRSPKVEERDSIDKLLELESMPLPKDWLQGKVAVCKATEEVVGFNNITIFDGDPYISPIVVSQSWRGKGVGKALIDDALTQYEYLCCVSEGRSKGFYEALGFEAMAWEEVARYPVSECECCPDKATCGPQPYRKKGK